MAGSKRKDVFLARLDRIEQERIGGAAPPQSPKNRASLGGGSGGGGGPVRSQPRRKRGFGRMLVLNLVGLLGLGLVGGAVYSVAQSSDLALNVPIRQTLSNFVTNSVARTPAFESHDGLLGSGPKERKLVDTGWVLTADYVAAEQRSDLPLNRIATVSDASVTEQEIDVQRFAANENCTLRRPGAREVVHTVRINDTARYTHMHVFSQEDVIEAVLDRIEGITRSPKHYKNSAIAEGRMGQVDVYVTDTSAPVYLNLQSFNRDIAWNIHLAQDVSLAHVAIIGRKSAFAAPQGDFTYEAVHIEDFRKDDDRDMYENDESRACMVVPFRTIQDHWPIHEKLTHPIDADHYQRRFRVLTKGYQAFYAWYATQTGMKPDVNLVQAETAAHALVGPVPNVPLTSEPIQHRKIHVVENDFVAFGIEQLDAPHQELLLAATGGDLSILNPEPIKVIQQ